MAAAAVELAESYRGHGRVYAELARGLPFVLVGVLSTKSIPAAVYGDVGMTVTVALIVLGSVGHLYSTQRCDRGAWLGLSKHRDRLLGRTASGPRVVSLVRYGCPGVKQRARQSPAAARCRNRWGSRAHRFALSLEQDRGEDPIAYTLRIIAETLNRGNELSARPSVGLDRIAEERSRGGRWDSVEFIEFLERELRLSGRPIRDDE